MRTQTTMKLAVALAGALVTAAAGTMLVSAASPKFYADDPVWVEPDTQDASSMKPLDVDLFVDLASNVVMGKKVDEVRRAGNIQHG